MLGLRKYLATYLSYLHFAPAVVDLSGQCGANVARMCARALVTMGMVARQISR